MFADEHVKFCGECAAYTYLRCILRRVFTPTTGPTKGQRLCPMCAPPAGQVAGDLPDQRQMEASRAPENFLRSLDCLWLRGLDLKQRPLGYELP